MKKHGFYAGKSGAAAALGLALALFAAPAMGQLQDVKGTIVDQKGYRLRNVIINAEGLYDTTDLEGKFGIGRGPVVGVRGAASRARTVHGPSLAGATLRFSGVAAGAVVRAELRLASGRSAGSVLSLPSAGGLAYLDLDALAAGQPKEGLFVLKVDAGSGAEHHLLARAGGGAWILSTRAGASSPNSAPAKTALRKSSAAPAKIRLLKAGYESQEIDVPSDGDVGVITLKLDANASVVDAPFDVAPLYYPTGWAGDYAFIKVSDETAIVRTGDPDAKCTKWTYQVRLDTAFLGWAAVIWQYPPNNWGTKPGRRVNGATKITFWAKGEAGGEAVDFKTGNDTYQTEPDPGMWKDTYGAAIREPLTSDWKKYEIPLEGSNTSMVISGFVWAATMGNDGAPVTFYVDEVRFE